MDLLKSEYRNRKDREDAAILREARRVYPLREWNSASEFLFALERILKGKSYSRTRWGLTRALTRAGVYKTDGNRHPYIDFSGYDERVS